MKSAIFTILLWGHVLLVNQFASGQTKIDPSQSYTFTRVEKNHLDSLKNTVEALFDNLDLSWNDILKQLERLENYTIKKHGRNSLSHAFIIHKKGVLCYNKGSEGDTPEFRNAILFYEQAAAMRLPFRTRYYKIVTPDVIYSYSNIGSCYWKLHDPFKTIEYTVKALHFADNYPVIDSILDITSQSKTLLARAYNEIGDYDNALQYYSSILEDISKIKNVTLKNNLSIWKLRALIEMGGMQADRLDQPELSLANLTLAEKILLSDQYPKGDILLANVYHDMGIAYVLMHDFPKSLACYRKSIALNKKIHNTQALVDNFINLGELLNKMNVLDSAVFYLKKAGTLNSTSDKFIASFVYDNLSDVEFKKGNMEKSIALDNLTMQCLVPEFKPMNVYANPILEHVTVLDKEGLLLSLASKANTLLAQYTLSKKINHLKSAYETFLSADTIIGKIRSEFLEDASKMTLVKKVKPIYEQAINVSWELYALSKDEAYLNQAFELSEKSRSIILLDAARKAKANFNIASPLVAKERQLSLKINYFERQSLVQFAQEISATRGIRDSLLLYRRQHILVLGQIKKEYPNYYHLAFEQPVINPNKVKELLSSDQALIEYFVGDHTLFEFVVTRNSTSFIKKDLSFPLHVWIDEFIKHIYRQDDEFIQPAFNLYEQLILPLAEHGQLKSNLIIVPDDVLGSIPFDVLVKKKPTGKRIYFPTYKDYLLFDHQIGYAFSATTLQESQTKKSHAQNSFLGVAPNLTKGFFINHTFFDKLDWNTDEVEHAQTIFGGTCLYRDHATKESFLEKAPDYGIIHLATHAKANVDAGDLSYIVFGTSPADLLFAKDLYALNLNANMVVLSACQTGAGSLSKGEGIISLARGFIYAGASSIITSLWNVNEATNNDIILYFYQGIRDGLPKDQALREAKLRFLKSVTLENQQNAHPFYWAPLICIGDLKPYHVDVSFPWKWGSLLIIVLLGVLWLLKRQL